MDTLQKYFSLGCFASLFAFGWGLAVDLFGARTVINEALPILETVLPFFGAGIIITVPFAAAEYLKNQAIHELEDLQTSGEELLTWASTQKPEAQPLPRAQSSLRHIILIQKYKRWLKKPIDNPSVGDFVRGAAECAEILRAYGYIRGRYMIWREYRRWNKMTASARTKK